MVAINTYVTLSDFKAWITAAGQTLQVDPADDAVLERILENTSRYIDTETNRTFYPRVETRYFNVPEDEELLVDDDLLAITSITNGDDVAVSSTDYNLLPLNRYPKFSIRLKDSVGEYWEDDSDGESIGVIDVAGIWGYHNDYGRRAWKTGTTLSAAIATTSATSASVTSAALFDPGQIIKIDSEFMLVTAVGGTTLTIERGVNGSTAATHLISAVVYIWTPQPDIWQAVVEIANNSRLRRFGENMTGVSTVSPAGVIVGPHDLTETARTAIARYRRNF